MGDSFRYHLHFDRSLLFSEYKRSSGETLGGLKSIRIISHKRTANLFNTSVLVPLFGIVQTVRESAVRVRREIVRALAGVSGKECHTQTDEP